MKAREGQVEAREGQARTWIGGSVAVVVVTLVVGAIINGGALAIGIIAIGRCSV